MKKFIIGALFGVLIASIVGVIALETLIPSTSVTYDKDGETITVNEALNELFNSNLNVDISSYGIVRSITDSSSKWLRIGASEDLVANAQIGNTTVRNDFDNIYPWSDIKSYNYDLTTNKITAWYGDANFKFDGTNGEVMTYIPEFYYKRYQENGYEFIYISRNAKEGYIKSEAFSIGRYTISTGTHSKSGTTPQNYTSLTDFRNQATALGSGWQLMDYHYFIIQLLYLVEYADYDSQAKLGQGNTNNSGAITSGGCNGLGMKSGTLNNDGKHSMIYRGIEDIYGNEYQFLDGINKKGNKIYISYNPSKYAVDKFNDGYNELGYNILSTNQVYTSKLGYDSSNSLIAFPTEGNGSATTYITDYYWYNSGNKIAVVGGYWSDTSLAGLWFWSCYNDSTFAYASVGARLLKTN